MSTTTPGDNRVKVIVAIIGAVSTLGAGALAAGVFTSSADPGPIVETASPDEESNGGGPVPSITAEEGDAERTHAPRPSTPPTTPGDGSAGPDDEPSSDAIDDGALTMATLELSQNHGYDLDTVEPVELPLRDTDGLDIGLSNYNPTLESADGATLIRTTSPPTIESCRTEEGGTTSSNDYALDQWFCFGTSSGRTGYFQVTDITETAGGTIVTIDYTLDGEPTPDKVEADASATTATLKLSQDHGYELDAAEPVELPLRDTDGLDIGLSNYNPTLESADGAVLIRTTSAPTIESCREEQGGTTSSNDYALDHWFCFGTSNGRTGYFQVIDITDTAGGTIVTIEYTLDG